MGEQALFKIDLHIHTPASRCGKDRDSPELPSRIIRQSMRAGLSMIAITDHHAAGYIDRVREAAALFDSPPTVLPGIELSTQALGVPDIYFLALFSENFPVEKIKDLMEELEIPPQETGNCHYRIKKPIDTILETIYRREGIAVSNHMDKNEARLKFVPELTGRYGIRFFDLKFPESASLIQGLAPSDRFTFFTFSDVHSADGIGQRFSQVELPEPSFAGIRSLHPVSA
ncbi:MAG: hypothetical protein ACE5GM_06895 [bacterium]